MLQAVVNNLYSYTNGADPPSPTALDPQQIAVKREESRKMSWVQATAYNISHQQKELVGKPHKDIDRDSLGHISYEAHWLKAGKSGKLVAALPQTLYSALGRSNDLVHVFWIEPANDTASISGSETISRKAALEQKFANFSKEAERAKNDIQSAMDDEIECNIGQKDSKKSSSQLAMEQKIKDHLRELDSKATRKEAGHMVISSDEQGRVQKTVKANRRKVVKSEMEGGDDWLLL